MSDKLTVVAREKLGSRNSQKLRSEGNVPAILYGHKEESVSLSVPLRQLEKALRHNAKVVDLEGAASGQAIVQALQWDTFHRDLLHLDLLRVSKGEKVHVTIPVSLKGDAPGANGGGMVEQVLTQVELEAAPASIPEVLHIDISQLELGSSISAGKIIDLPEGATLVTDENQMIVHCVPPAGAPALDATAAAETEPEVVGKKEEGSEDS